MILPPNQKCHPQKSTLKKSCLKLVVAPFPPTNSPIQPSDINLKTIKRQNKFIINHEKDKYLIIDRMQCYKLNHLLNRKRIIQCFLKIHIAQLKGRITSE